MLLGRPLFLSAAIMASAVAGCTAPSDAVAPNPVTLSSGIPGGVYHPVGNAICRMFNLDGKHQETPCIAVSSDGSVENIRRVDSTPDFSCIRETGQTRPRDNHDNCATIPLNSARSRAEDRINIVEMGYSA